MSSSTNLKAQQSSLSHRRNTLFVIAIIAVFFILGIKQKLHHKQRAMDNKSSATTSGVPYKDAGNWSSTWWFPEISTEPQIGTQVAIESSLILPHLIYLPPPQHDEKNDDNDASASEKKKIPLFAFLHGQGESQPTPLPKVALQGPPQYVGRHPGNLGPFAILSPQKKMNAQFYDEDTASKIIQLIDYYIKKYNIDKSRIYLTGVSQGGIGTWNLAATPKYNKVFAAIAPVCGGLQSYNIQQSAQVLSDTPIYAVHGANDVILPVSMSRTSVKACNSVERTKYAGEIVYIEVENAAGSDYGWQATNDLVSLHMEGHASWVNAYYPEGGTFVPGELPPLYTWFLRHKRVLEDDD